MLLFLIKISLLSLVTATIVQFTQISMGLGLLQLFAIAFLIWFFLGVVIGNFSNNDEYDENNSKDSSILLASIKGLFWGAVIGTLIIGIISLNLEKTSCANMALEFFTAIPLSGYQGISNLSSISLIVTFIAWWAIIGAVISIALNRKFIGAFVSFLIIGALAYTHSIFIPNNLLQPLGNALNNLRGKAIKSTEVIVEPVTTDKATDKSDGPENKS